MNNYYDNEPLRRRRRRREPEAERKPRKRKSSPIKKFFTILITVAAIYLVALGIFTIAAHFTPDPNDKPMDVLTSMVVGKVPERTNFVVMCTDEDGTRTDTIMVGCYNSVDNKISIVSIPRDTLVSVSAASYEIMKEEYPYPTHKEMQINHVHHFAGEKEGPEVLKEEIESFLNIELDYYVRVDFDAFKYFVDSIGGVEFDVPMDMDYEDPTQDLYIHLTQGLQTLDGDKAEQVVRFRSGYKMGDIDRIAVQQSFIRALIKKAAMGDTITKNPKAYVSTMLKYVTTNASLSDMVKYAGELKKLNTDNIETYTLPGKARNRYYCDQEATAELVFDIFKRPLGADNSEVSSKSATIQVLNGGYTNGKAAEVQGLLTGEGYFVKDIDTFEGTKKEETVIYVRDPALGQDLVPYFKSAKVVADEEKTGEYDIVIVIGTEE